MTVGKQTVFNVLQGGSQPIPVDWQRWDGEELIFTVSSANGVFGPDDVIAILSQKDKRPVWLGQVTAITWDEEEGRDGPPDDTVAAVPLWGELPRQLGRQYRVCRWGQVEKEAFLARMASQAGMDVIRIGEHIAGLAPLMVQSVTGIVGDSVGGKQLLLAELAQQLCQHGVWVLDPTGQYSVPNEVCHRFTGEDGISLKDVGWVTLANYLGHQFPAELRQPLWDWLAQSVSELEGKPFWVLEDWIEQARKQKAMPLIEADLNRLAAHRIFASRPTQVLPINQKESNKNRVHRLDVSQVPEPWRGLIVHWVVQVLQRYAHLQDKKPYVMVVSPDVLGGGAFQELSRLHQKGFGLSVVAQSSQELVEWEEVGSLSQVFTASHQWLLESVSDEAMFVQPDANHLYDVAVQCQGRASLGLPIVWDIPGNNLVIHRVEPCAWGEIKAPAISETYLTTPSSLTVNHKPESSPSLEVTVPEVSDVPVLALDVDNIQLQEPQMIDQNNPQPVQSDKTPEKQPIKELEELSLEEALAQAVDAEPEISYEPPAIMPVPDALDVGMGLEDLQDALNSIDKQYIVSENLPMSVVDSEDNPLPERVESVAPVRRTKNNRRLRKEGGALFEVGDRVMHPRYGEGIVDRLIPTGQRMTVRVMFKQSGKRLLDAERSALKVL